MSLKISIVHLLTMDIEKSIVLKIWVVCKMLWKLVVEIKAMCSMFVTNKQDRKKISWIAEAIAYPKKKGKEYFQTSTSDGCSINKVFQESFEIFT
jgi:hypothetical protein